MPRPTTEEDHIKQCGERAAGALSALEEALDISESIPVPDKERLAGLAAGLKDSCSGLNNRLTNTFKQLVA